MYSLERPRPTEVHVWQVTAPGPGGLPRGWTDALSAEELERAGRFRSDVDRLRYMQTRWWLRSVIGAYLGLMPGSLEFSVSPRGKPWLALPATAWLRFSISHSHDLLALAVANSCEVGVDVERVPGEPGEIRDAIAVLSSGDREELARCATDADRALRFCQIWTRREAALKASGAGLGDSPMEGPQGGGPGEPRTSSDRGSAAPRSEFSLAQIEFGRGFVGAVAANVVGARLPSYARSLAPENFLMPS
ncbi:MAG: 4'-phosphopantetheinyl transferase superfamily protein [Candidatus Dormibacteraeota bacterium]|nr:4'-phosphopantetheinyl transferase superfamily protein [Candidatus Dormibacteraeota bacterium]